MIEEENNFFILPRYIPFKKGSYILTKQLFLFLVSALDNLVFASSIFRERNTVSKASILFINSLFKLFFFSLLVKTHSVYSSSGEIFSNVDNDILLAIISPKVDKLGGYVKDILCFPSLWHV
ncbi:hypothetical protein Hanom_Chr06g00535321 [Helianthus anomalus]|nr:hypothetical protein HanHA89_CPg0756981 [Helianthus annuus]